MQANTTKKEAVREIVETLNEDKTRIWFIFRKEKCTGALRNTKRPGRSLKGMITEFFVC